MSTKPCSSHDPSQSKVHYERRRPEASVLYQLVQDNLETFLAQMKAESDGGLPEFVKKEFDAFLECGILAHGFVRARCGDCAHEKLVAFSCKRRGFCPSCGARRMAESAAHLVDQVIPRVPVRQWVLSFPLPLRYLLAAHPDVLAPILKIVNRAVSNHLIDKARFRRSEAKGGAVTLIQRFGSAANLNIHLHALVLDGVYREEGEAVVFHAVPAPTDKEITAVLGQIVTKTMALLTRAGYVVEEEGRATVASDNEEGVLAPLQAASITYRIAYGPRQGQKLLTLQSQAAPSPAEKKRCVSLHGFSLHANVRCAANARQPLERLCRYITRPALANERLAINAAGQVVLELKTPYRDGTTHLLFSPLEFLQRLAALVPRPRLNLIRFHGVLAPNAKWRAQIVPGGQAKVPNAQQSSDADQVASPRYRMNWARLLKRVFKSDLAACPDCGGELKIIAAITQPSAINKLLTHFGLPTRAPPRAPAKFSVLHSFEF